MNTVQPYTPPRFLALCLAGLVFVIYQLGWRDHLMTLPQWGNPVDLPVAFGASLVLGYGLAMIVWLLRQTRRQVAETFRPTRGRIIGAIALALLTPFGVFSWMPFILGALLPLLFSAGTLQFLTAAVVATGVAYPIAAMIIRHTYQRRGLRFCMFALVFWSVYAAHILVRGQQVFTL